MGSRVLIITTAYDVATYYSRDWAGSLHGDLLRAGHTCLMLHAEALCHASTTVADALARVDMVVFYGHGLTDRWVALPGVGGVADIAVIDASRVRLLDNKKVYAGCCNSLAQLGLAFQSLTQN